MLELIDEFEMEVEESAEKAEDEQQVLGPRRLRRRLRPAQRILFGLPFLFVLPSERTSIQLYPVYTLWRKAPWTFRGVVKK